MAKLGNKCATCKGIGLLVIQEHTTMYACGFYTQAKTCEDCLGSGRIIPNYIDAKLLAAGDVQ